MTSARRVGAALLVAAGVSACGGGGGSPTPITSHAVTLDWQANRETGVNSTGGGYEVSISGRPTIVVPYTAGPAAPTSTMVTLTTGTYTVTVRAFATLDPQGGSAGNFSANSQALTVNVP